MVSQVDINLEGTFGWGGRVGFLWGESEGYANEDEDAAIRQDVGSSALVEVLETLSCTCSHKKKKKKLQLVH